MPELPEVETIKRQLEESLIGKTIETIDIRLPRSVRGNGSFLIGQTILAMRRFSKLIVIDVSGLTSFAIHLKMTGRLVFDDMNRQQDWDLPYATDKHTRVVITFTDSAALYFHDQRTFGYIEVLPTAEVSQLPYIASLGPEFLSTLTKQQFITSLSKSSRKIKIFLLDQQMVAGIGNIYANEALWKAKVHPERAASSLTDHEKHTLFYALEEVLRLGITLGGASRDNFRDSFGRKGTMQEHFSIYNQSGKPCPRCNRLIVKYQLQGRGTYICPHCQKIELSLS